MKRLLVAVVAVAALDARADVTGALVTPDGKAVVGARVALHVATPYTERFQRFLDTELDLFCDVRRTDDGYRCQSDGMLGLGADGHPRIAFPARFDGRRLRVDAAVPALGAHSPSGSIEAGGSRPPRAAAGRDSWRRLRRWIAR